MVDTETSFPIYLLSDDWCSLSVCGILLAGVETYLNLTWSDGREVITFNKGNLPGWIWAKQLYFYYTSYMVTVRRVNHMMTSTGRREDENYGKNPDYCVTD